MNVLDTSAWLEILAGGPRADRFLGGARINGYLLVPSLIVAEVVHHVHAHLGDGAAIDALAALSRGTPVPFTAAMAGAAARAAEEFGLSFRHSLIYVGHPVGADFDAHPHGGPGRGGMEGQGRDQQDSPKR